MLTSSPILPRARHALALPLLLAAVALGGWGEDDTDPPAAATGTTSGAAREATAAPPTDGELTPAGTELAVGDEAVVGYTSLSAPRTDPTAPRPTASVRVRVEAIERKATGDLDGIDLSPSDAEKIPYFVRVSITAGAEALRDGDDPDIVLRAIDSRGESTSSVTLLGTFAPCEDRRPEGGLDADATHESCLIFLLPAGTTLAEVAWPDGPAEDTGVTPYFSEPVTWSAG